MNVIPKLAAVPAQHIELTRKATISGVTYIKSGRFKKRYTGNKNSEVDINGNLWLKGADLKKSLKDPDKPGRRAKSKTPVETGADAISCNKNNMNTGQMSDNLSTQQGPADADFKDLSTSKPQREYKIKKSVVRQRLLGYINTMKGKKELYFWTVTFPAGTSDAIAYQIFNIWLTRLRQKKMLKEYLWVAERQENGTVHFHSAIPHRMDVIRANSLMRETLMYFSKNKQIPFTQVQCLKYNGVDIAKNRKTGRITNFAIKKGQKSLAIYITKYVSKSECVFHHLAWHNSRGFSSLFTGITFSKQEFDITKMHYHLNFAKAHENEWCIFVPWRGEPPKIFTRHLYALNSYVQNQLFPYNPDDMAAEYTPKKHIYNNERAAAAATPPPPPLDTVAGFQILQKKIFDRFFAGYEYLNDAYFSQCFALLLLQIDAEGVTDYFADIVERIREVAKTEWGFLKFQRLAWAVDLINNIQSLY